jgi:TM2 domain-containing membrane protein YozV
MNIYIIKDNEAQGPFSLDQTVESIRNGEHSLSSLAWREGMADWQPVHALTDIVQAVLPPIPAKPEKEQLQTTPPPIPTQLDKTPQIQVPGPSTEAASDTAKTPVKPESDKCRVPAMLLCFFLGGFGLHAFYAERRMEGAVLVILFVIGVLAAATGAGWGVLCVVLVQLYNLCLTFVIALGKYTDGQGRSITKWI